MEHSPGKQVVNLGSNPTTVAAADLTENGRLDLIAGSAAGPLEIAAGEGDGKFGPPASFGDPAGSNQQIGTADLTGDGAQDIITVDGNITILFNKVLPRPAAALRNPRVSTIASSLVHAARSVHADRLGRGERLDRGVARDDPHVPVPAVQPDLPEQLRRHQAVVGASPAPGEAALGPAKAGETGPGGRADLGGRADRRPRRPPPRRPPPRQRQQHQQHPPNTWEAKAGRCSSGSF